MNIKSIRDDFPLLKNTDTIYLDSAATALKPQAVIDAVVDYYANYPANVFRGLYPISGKATDKYEEARETISQFVNAKSANEIIFVGNTTDAVNLVAYAWGRMNIDQGDEIVTSIVEHHSNFLPWQELANESGATLKVLDVDPEYHLPDISDVVTKKTKLVALTHVSNVLGTIVPIKKLVEKIKKINPHCIVFADGAQAVPHMSVDVQDLGVDFYAFSGHKMLGPTGIGALWGKKEILEAMPPFRFGGSMIEEVALEKSTFAPIPTRFEAGTPHIAGAIGMAEAANYMEVIGMDAILKHETDLSEYAIKELSAIAHTKLYGPRSTENRVGVLSFNIYNNDGRLIHPHDVGDILGNANICVRAGHHCAMPLAKRLNIPASTRASFHIYNTTEDVDRLVETLKKIQKMFS